MKTKKVFLSLVSVLVATLFLAQTTPAYALLSIRSVLGCDADHTNCQTGKVSQGQTLFVTVIGLSPEELDSAHIAFDDVSFISETQLVNSETGELKLFVSADDVDFGNYELSVRGLFNTISYPGGLTVVRGAGGGGGNNGNTSNGGNNGNTSNSSGGGSISTGLDKIKDQFPTGGDLGQSRTVGDIIIAVIKILLGILLAVTVLFIIIGGFQFVTSAGNEDQAKKGRKTLTYAVIGLVVVILAYTLVNVVVNSVSTPSI